LKDGLDRVSLLKVWALAWPIILSNVTTPLLGIVDTAVVGRLPGPQYIGAVAVGAVAFTSVFWLFGFLRMGTSGFAAQANGADERNEVLAVLARAVLLAIALGLIMVLLRQPIWSLAAYFLSTSERVSELAGQYFLIRSWTAPAALTNYAVLGWLIGMQRTRMALLLQVWLNGVNIILDLVFVVGLDMGVPGVAWATLIGEYTAAILGLGLAWRIIRPSRGQWRDARIADLARLRAFFSANLDIMIRTASLIASFFVFTRIGAQFGDLTLAANAVLMQLVHFMAFGLDGFAFAAEALVGTALGARRLPDLRRAVIASTVWAFVIALGFSLVYALAGTSIIALITTLPEVRAAAEAYLPWVMLYPLLAVWCFQLDGIFIGATQTAEMRNSMVLAMAGFMTAAWFLPGIWGNHGLWLSLNILSVLRFTGLAAYYRRIERRATIPAA
jgi:MATE family multidrug resistance protein